MDSRMACVRSLTLPEARWTVCAATPLRRSRNGLHLVAHHVTHDVVKLIGAAFGVGVLNEYDHLDARVHLPHEGMHHAILRHAAIDADGVVVHCDEAGHLLHRPQ